MKTIKSLIVILLTSFSSMGQSVNINTLPPDNSNEISKNQALNHAITKFNNNKIVTASITGNKSDHIYQYKDIILSFTAHAVNINDDYLDKLKVGIDAIYKNDKTYSSTIKHFKNHSTFINTYELSDGTRFYRFYSFCSDNKKGVTGYVIFNKLDSNDAESTLNSFINHINYKLE